MRRFDDLCSQHAAGIQRAIDNANDDAERARHTLALDDFRKKVTGERAEEEIYCRRAATLLQRLLTDERMRPVWEVLTKAGTYRRDISHSSIFAIVALRAWMGPFGEELWTPADREQWLRDVADLTEKLASKLEHTGAEDFLWRRYLSAKHSWDIRQAVAAGWRGEETPPERRYEFQWHPGNVSAFLRSLGESAEKCLAPARLDRPRDPYARRAYFVRSMAEWCRKGLDGSRVDLITPTAAVALADDSIAERQVYRLIEEKRDSDATSKKKGRKRH
jgi:hypothetical protein